MKKLFYTLSIVSLCQTAVAGSYRDSHQYNIMDESSYAILMYDLKNSLIQQFGKGSEPEGEIRASFIIGNLDLPKIKKEIIYNLQKEKIIILKGETDRKKLKQVTFPFVRAVNNYLPTIKNPELSDAFIYMYMLTPEFYGKEWNGKYPKAMLHNAESIAISRFDKHQWFTQIADCYHKNSQEKDMIETIAECSHEYQQLISQETGKVIQQLEPYRKLFENLY